MKNKKNLVSRGLLAASLISISACAKIDEHHDPQLSDLSVDESIISEAAIVSIPMPEKIETPTPVRSEGASLWQKGSTGFFGDQRATEVGDILTVLIEIDDQAQLENGSSRSRKSANSVGAPTLFGYETRIDKVLPGIGAADVPAGGLMDLSSKSSSEGEGSIERNEKISLKVAAMIIKRLENGNFVIAGRQEVRVNSELRELRVAGVVRPVDIGMNNSVPYDKIAEARITYGGRGQISRVQQPRYGEDALDVILPY